MYRSSFFLQITYSYPFSLPFILVSIAFPLFRLPFYHPHKSCLVPLHCWKNKIQKITQKISTCTTCPKRKPKKKTKKNKSDFEFWRKLTSCEINTVRSPWDCGGWVDGVCGGVWWGRGGREGVAEEGGRNCREGCGNRKVGERKRRGVYGKGKRRKEEGRWRRGKGRGSGKGI